MPFYRDHVYPRLVAALGNPKPVHKIRQQLILAAEGKVLEIGVGPGMNFVHYDPTKVKKIYALEPNPGMIPRAEQQGRRTQTGYRISRFARRTNSSCGRQHRYRGEHFHPMYDPWCRGCHSRYQSCGETRRPVHLL